MFWQCVLCFTSGNVREKVMMPYIAVSILIRNRIGYDIISSETCFDDLSKALESGLEGI
jgi:hypothetical protein